MNRKGRQDGSLELTSVLPNKANLQPFTASVRVSAQDTSGSALLTRRPAEVVAEDA
jgi:hypothetical protein